MLSADVKRLRDTFEAWGRGDPFPDEEAWRQFNRDLRDLQFRVAMLELGVDLTVVDVAVEATKPNSNVVFLRPNARRVAPADGGAS
jgi:hypothetical protein